MAHFNDVLIYVLLAAALKAVMGHWIDMAVILAVAVINALIGLSRKVMRKNRCRAFAICSPAKR
jgi:magnesium-transporting ATPase (P-type)